LVDIFKAEEQPSHVITVESLKQLKQNLTDSALLIINWHGYMAGEIGKGSSILNNTLISSGYHVKVCTNSSNENYRNLIFVCSLNEINTLPFEIKANFEKINLLNTDDVPLFEKYNAIANKAWRSNYLNYYLTKGI
jgi:hypothetical protein